MTGAAPGVPPVSGALSATARMIATTAHLGQRDKGGQAYISHPSRVAHAVREAGYSDEVEAVAWLHDVVEDTPVTLDALREFGMPEHVVFAVDCVSQRRKEPRDDYYARVQLSPLAHVVKWYDVADNDSPARLALLSPETQQRLRDKYVKARQVLGGPPRRETT